MRDHPHSCPEPEDAALFCAPFPACFTVCLTVCLHGVVYRPGHQSAVLRAHEFHNVQPCQPEFVAGKARLFKEPVVRAQYLTAALLVFYDTGGSHEAVEDDRGLRFRVPEFAVVEEARDARIHVKRSGPSRTQAFFKFRRGHRLRVKIALCESTADRLEEVGLARRFHPLRDDRHVEPVRHTHDGVEDHAAAAFAGGRREEFHIQLYHVHHDVFEHVERGIAAAEVVHLDEEAVFAKPLHDADKLLRVLRIGSLRDFQPQHLCRKPVFFNEAVKDLSQFWIVDVDPRDVDRDRRHGTPLVEPSSHQRAYLFPYIFVKLHDEAVLLKNFYKFSGGQYLALVEPARERFGADYLPAGHVVLRL